MNTPSGHLPADAEIRVTVESGNQPVEISNKKMSTEQKGESKTGGVAQSSLNQILSSLAETRKYLPTQVYTFLDTMEGKTLDDLRMEAMHLANKAQDEAKKRTENVKTVVDTANHKVQDVAEAARSTTTDMANNIAQKGKDIVQPPIDLTKEATKSLAAKVNDTTTGLVSRNLERARNIAMKGYMATSERLTPVIQPVASRAAVYLPAPAQTFLKENVEGKSLDQLYNEVIRATRTNLLSVKEDTPTELSLPVLAGEIKTATLSGDILRNSLSLSERMANNLFGETEIPKDATSLRRMYNLSNKVTGGMMNYANTKMWQTKDMVTNRTDSYRNSVMQRVNPVMDRIWATPIIPSFVFRILRGEQPRSKEMPGFAANAGQGLEIEGEGKKRGTIPSTSVHIDMVGVKPVGAAKVETAGGKTESTETISGGEEGETDQSKGKKKKHQNKA